MKRTLTMEDVNSVIEKEEVCKLGVKTTAVILTLKNGFEVVGTASCVDPANYNEEKAAEMALKKALDKVWELEGYLLQNKEDL